MAEEIVCDICYKSINKELKITIANPIYTPSEFILCEKCFIKNVKVVLEHSDEFVDVYLHTSYKSKKKESKND